MTIEQALQECYIHYVGEKNIALDNGDTTKARICNEIASFCWKLRETLNKIEAESAERIEPKFKVGDWVVRKDGGVFFNDRKFAQITEIDGEKHWFDTGLIYLKAEDMRLWTLEDAEDGDILYSKKHNLLWRYKNTKESYCCINLNYNSNNISIGDVMVIPNDVRPATKEQCGLLFAKMRAKGYEWNSKKKEVIRNR